MRWPQKWYWRNEELTNHLLWFPTHWEAWSRATPTYTSVRWCHMDLIPSYSIQGRGYLKHVPLPAFCKVEPAPLRIWCVHVFRSTICGFGYEFFCFVKHLLKVQKEVEEEMILLITNVFFRDHVTSLQRAVSQCLTVTPEIQHLSCILTLKINI